MTFPLPRNCGSSSLTRLIGIAKPMPMLPPVRLKIAVLMPIDFAAQIDQRPAGVTRIDRRVGLNEIIVRSLADMAAFGADNPEVTVLSRPNGLPIATTHSPTSSRSESPKLRRGRLVFALILIIAISVFGSRPMTLASYS